MTEVERCVFDRLKSIEIVHDQGGKMFIQPTIRLDRSVGSIGSVGRHLFAADGGRYRAEQKFGTFLRRMADSIGRKTNRHFFAADNGRHRAERRFFAADL